MIGLNGFCFLPGPLSSDSIRAQINHKLTKESAQEQKIGTRNGTRKSQIPCARQQNYLRAGAKRPTTGSNTKHTSECETTRTSKCETTRTSKCKTKHTSKCETKHTSKHNNNQHKTQNDTKHKNSFRQSNLLLSFGCRRSVVFLCSSSN